MLLIRPNLPLILLISTLTFTTTSTAQAQIEPEKNRTFVGVGVQHLQFNYKSGTGILAYLDVPVSNNWSFHYSIGAGIADKSGVYTHLPLPAAAGIAAIALGDIGWLGVIVCLIPEGVSYTVRRTQRVDLRLTATPLSLYFWKSDTEWKEPMIPQIGTMILVKQKNGVPMLKFHASLMYQISTKSAGVQFGGVACIPLK